MVTNNAINANGTGLVKYDGAGTYSAVTTTQYDLLIGAASNGITSVAPSATSGIPVISQGASANPTFGTALVAGGGTGITSTTAYGLITGGTTTTGAFQTVTPGSAGTVVKSGGTGGLHTYSTAFTLTNDVMSNTAQPCFVAYLSANLTNLTGDGTSYKVIFDSEVFDQGNNFSTGASSLFTAPVEGKYMFSWTMNFYGIDAGHTDLLVEVLAAGAYNQVLRINPYPIYQSAGTVFNGSIICSMTAGATAGLYLTVSSGNKTVSIASSTIGTKFSGHLIC